MYKTSTKHDHWASITEQLRSYWVDVAEKEFQREQDCLVMNLPRADFESDTPYYEFPGGVEVREISAHLASFPAQIVQYASRSGRMDGNCKSNDTADRIQDFKKILDFAQWEIDRLEGL